MEYPFRDHFLDNLKNHIENIYKQCLYIRKYIGIIGRRGWLQDLLTPYLIFILTEESIVWACLTVWLRTCTFHMLWRVFHSTLLRTSCVILKFESVIHYTSPSACSNFEFYSKFLDFDDTFRLIALIPCIFSINSCIFKKALKNPV